MSQPEILSEPAHDGSQASRTLPAVRAWPWFALAAAMVLADQLTKAMVAAALPLGDSVPVTSYFNLVHVLNPGAAFSFLADAGGWQRYAFSVLGILVSLWLSFEIWRGRVGRLERFAYAMVMGGALGNVVDRLRQGAVVDFLDFHWQNSHWPAFNVADIAINIGVAALIIATLRDARRRKA